MIAFMPGEKIKGFISQLYLDFRRAMTGSFTWYQLCLTLSVWCLSWMCYWLYLKFDGGPDISLIQSLIIFVIGTLGVTFVITPGGIGSYEAIMTYTLTGYHYPTELAFASAIGLRLMIILPNLIVAAYIFFYEGMDFLNHRFVKLS